MNATFPHIDRYRLVRPLGEGGMGRVYEVDDLVLGRRVALKTLLRADPLSLYLFKNEFRALADVAHRNLVGLYELGVADDVQYFTMELVPDAVDLLRSVRGEEHPRGDTWLRSAELDPNATLPPQLLDDQTDADVVPVTGSALAAEGVHTMRRLLGQLAEALAALHAAQRLHLDVKPSNVLVTEGQRLVLVDFGLVASLEPAHLIQPGMIAGSIPYMSPEQARGAEVTRASDWYAFGAVLYELLVGRPPFIGDRAAVLAAKAQREVVPPSRVVDGVSPDLDALTVGLLSADPDRRPSAREVLEAFGRTAPEPRAFATPLVGRDRHLVDLRAAWQSVRDGRCTMVHLTGQSGMGKSQLCARFLEERRADAECLVLSARCYERDHVPFKAVDPWIDALVPWLMALPRREATGLIPRHAYALTRLFPVLLRVGAMADAVGHGTAAADSREEQRRAFEALRELLGRIGDRRALALHVDDMQWMDPDSVDVLAGLLRPPDPPRVLWLLSFRSDGTQRHPSLGSLPSPDTRLEVGPLDDDDARTLVRCIHPGMDEAMVARCISQGAGSPFLLTELAHEARSLPDERVDIDAFLHRRISELPPGAGELLQVVALASAPIARRVALRAAGDPAPTVLMALKAGRMLQSDLAGGGERLQCYHDRIRHAAVVGLGDDAARVHLAIAVAMEDEDDAEPERLCRHFIAAGQTERAIHYARIAVDEASDQLAFDRAAEGLRVLLDLLGPDDQERGPLLVRLARTLNSGGHTRRASDVFREAAALLDDPELETEAALCLQWCGRTAEARPMLLRGLAAAGYRAPRSVLAAALGILWYRLRARLSPLRVYPNPRGSIAPEVLRRLETVWFLGFSLFLSDQTLSFHVISWFASEARRLGDPALFPHAMQTEILVCHLEPWASDRGRRAYQLGLRVAREADDARAVAILQYWRAMALFQQGHGRAAYELLDAGLAAFVQPEVSRLTDDEHQRLVSWAGWRDWIRMYQAAGALHQRSFIEYTARFRTLSADARRRDDLLLEAHVQFAFWLHPSLCAGDPDGAEAEIQEVFSRSQQQRFDLIHFYFTCAMVAVRAYQHDWREGWAWVRARRSAVRRSGVLRSGSNAAQWSLAETVIAAGALSEGLVTNRELRWVQRGNARELSQPGWRCVMAGLSGAALHHALGERERALETLGRAHAAAQSEGMHNLLRLTRLQRLRLEDRPPADPELVASVEDLRRAGAADPMRLMDCLGPIRTRPS